MSSMPVYFSYQRSDNSSGFITYYGCTSVVYSTPTVEMMPAASAGRTQGDDDGTLVFTYQAVEQGFLETTYTGCAFAVGGGGPSTIIFTPASSE